MGKGKRLHPLHFIGRATAVFAALLLAATAVSAQEADPEAAVLDQMDNAAWDNRPAAWYFWTRQLVRLGDPVYRDATIAMLDDFDTAAALPENAALFAAIKAADDCYQTLCTDMRQLSNALSYDHIYDDSDRVGHPLLAQSEDEVTINGQGAQLLRAGIMRLQNRYQDASDRTIEEFLKREGGPEAFSDIEPRFQAIYDGGQFLEGFVDHYIGSTGTLSDNADFIHDRSRFIRDSGLFLAEGNLAEWSLYVADFLANDDLDRRYDNDLDEQALRLDECMRQSAPCDQLGRLAEAFFAALALPPDTLAALAQEREVRQSLGQASLEMSLLEIAARLYFAPPDDMLNASPQALAAKLFEYRLLQFVLGDGHQGVRRAREQLENAYVRANDINNALGLRFASLAAAQGDGDNYFPEALKTARMLRYFGRREEASALAADAARSQVFDIPALVGQRLKQLQYPGATYPLSDAAIGDLQQTLGSSAFAGGYEPFMALMQATCAGEGHDAKPCADQYVENLRRQFVREVLLWLNASSELARDGWASESADIAKLIIEFQTRYDAIGQPKRILAGLNCEVLMDRQPLEGAKCLEALLPPLVEPAEAGSDRTRIATAYYRAGAWSEGDRVLDAYIAELPSGPNCGRVHALNYKAQGLAARGEREAAGALFGRALQDLTAIYAENGGALTGDPDAIAEPDTGTVYFCVLTLDKAADLAEGAFALGDQQVRAAVLPQLRSILLSTGYAQQSDCFCPNFRLINAMLEQGRRADAEALFDETLARIEDKRFYRGGDAIAVRRIGAARAAAALGRIDRAFAILEQARARELGISQGLSVAGLERSGSAYGRGRGVSPTEALVELAWDYREAK